MNSSLVMEEPAVPPVALVEEHVPLKSRVWISGADAAAGILQSLVAGGALTYYFTILRGLSLELSGIVWLLFGVWNAVNDPLFGYISDRTKTRLGRRIPYIRFGAPLFVLGFILFWVYVPGSEGSQWTLFAQMLVALFLYDTLYTAIATSIYIMPYEVAVSNKARSGIYIWKIIFMVFTIVVPLVIEGTIKPAAGDEAGIQFFRLAMITIGVLMGLIIFASTFFYREKNFARETEQFAFVRSFKECFKNRAFILFETISFTIIFAQTALMYGLWMYFDEVSVAKLPLYLALAAGIISGIVLWIKKRDAWGIKLGVRLMCAAFTLACLSLLLGGRIPIPATLGFFLLGIGFSGGMYLIPLMNGDVVDFDEHRTGLRREGMYAGINSFITKPAISIAQWSVLTILGLYGYDQTLAKGLQSPQAETGILVGWTAATGLLMLLCFLALHYYPLSGPAWDRIKAQLSLVHREKERRALEKLGYRQVE
jgi:glycoside/pentoside/hexuronide:cation symporter, GPH family